jgi:hypothetical protein
MPAFSYAIKNDIDANISLMYTRLRCVSHKTLTHEDFIQLFVPAEHREMWRAAARLMVQHSRAVSYQWHNGPWLQFNLYDKGGSIPATPRVLELQPDAPMDLIQSITKWTTHGGDASGDCGRIMKLFDILNDKCSKSQLRFLWPSILTILCMDDNKTALKEWARELQELKPPKQPVELPREVLQACRRTSETVAMIALIPHDILSRQREHGEVEIYTSSGVRYNEPGLGEFYGLA